MTCHSLLVSCDFSNVHSPRDPLRAVAGGNRAWPQRDHSLEPKICESHRGRVALSSVTLDDTIQLGSRGIWTSGVHTDVLDET